ncbi:type II toxin-antitoxin system RelE/ParE family toxin [Demequina silvatica]|uniref:type II toxin-antitoxin system RelE/ParE family toxin n=1 Tax=Demequina silvatica TaxID=1638988 RepID=UPI0009E62A96|nr:type II toxin-antitoxin system RelE/ParE family toxin [Demequina silvatica]
MSVVRVVTTRGADADIAEALAHYAAEAGPALAVELVDALEAATTVLARQPAIGSARFAAATGIADLRGLALARFPYVMLYTVDSDAVRVHRVLLTARDIPTTLQGDDPG